MNLKVFMENYVQEIDGQHSEYDDNINIIIVPLPDERFQTVFAVVKHSERHNQEIVELTSKVCEYEEDINLKELMEENTNLCYGKFAIADTYIQVEATFFTDNLNEDLLKDAIQEVANVADEYEFKLTGADVY